MFLIGDTSSKFLATGGGFKLICGVGFTKETGGFKQFTTVGILILIAESS